MGHYTPAAKVWIGVVSVIALVTTGVNMLSSFAPLASWVGLLLLGACAGIAHIFPTRSAYGGTTYRITNVFVMAGAIFLPPALLTLLAIIALTPDSWRGRARPGARVRWLFNVSQLAVAAHVAALWISFTGADQIRTVFDLPLLLIAVSLFAVAQAALVAVIISLNSEVPFLRTGVFSLSALQGEGLQGVLAVAVAGLWLSEPLLLVLVIPVLVITHRMTRVAHLALMADVDVKTGLNNSRHFERVMEDELAHSHRMHRPLALLFADLDHFKKVNDQYGHVAGDAVLRGVSGLMLGMMRKGDIVARFGGEEFVAMLPGTDAREATYLAERVRAAVEAHEFDIDDGRTVRCTVSIGVAAYPDHGDDMASLLRRADTAMYHAKRTRNAVSCAEGLPPAALPQAQPSSETAAEPAPARPPRTGRTIALLLWSTIVAGLAMIAASIVIVSVQGSWLLLAPFVALALAAEFIDVRLYEAKHERMSFSFAIAVTMAAVIALPVAAPLISATAALVHVLVRRQTRIDKVLFNLANPALAAGMAAVVAQLLHPADGTLTVRTLMAAVAGVVTFQTLNFGVVSFMISLRAGRPVREVMRGTSWYTPTKMLLGLTGAFVGAMATVLGVTGMIMFAVPLLVMRFTLLHTARVSRQTIETLQAAKEAVEHERLEKEATLDRLIETISSIMDAREPWVVGHSRRVATYAVAIGRELGLDQPKLAAVQTAGLLHDLGKIAIPESILNKPGRLTADEYAVMKTHAEVGERILAQVMPLQDVARMVGEHHERYDGQGYPRGRRGDEISLGGRIIAIADALDAILSDRPYSQAKELLWALEELENCSGSHFDPMLVAATQRLVASRGSEFFTTATHQPDHHGCCRQWLKHGLPGERAEAEGATDHTTEVLQRLLPFLAGGTEDANAPLLRRAG